MQEVRPGRSALAAGWLFGAPEEAQERPVVQGATSYRLWAYRPDNGESIVLEEGAAPISSPSWSRDGTAIAFGRLAREPDSSSRWEVVVQDAPRRRRVVYREVIAGAQPLAEEVRDLAPAWSPDGRTLAVPTLKAPGLALVRVENGQTLRVLEGASRPRWSPEEAKLAFVKGSLASELFVLDAVLVEPRRVAEVPTDRDSLPGPLWSRDGQALLIVRRGAGVSELPGGAGARGDGLKLMRYRADTGQIESVVDLVHDPIGPEGGLIGAWFAPEPDGDAMFYVTASPGRRPVQVTWCLARPNEVQKRLNPFDESAYLGALATAPGGRRFAFRVGVGEEWTPPAICDPSSERLVCVAPDEATRAEWLARILDTLLPLLRQGVPAATLADGTPAERPSLLPAPGEFEPSDATSARMRRLARIGLPLIGASTEANDEIRLALAYLAADYPTALAAIDALEVRAPDVDRRLRLLGIRAQVLLARREFDRVAPLIAHLRTASSRRTFEVEEGPDRPKLVPISDAKDAWPELLAQKLEMLRKPKIDPVEAPDPDGDANRAGALEERLGPGLPAPAGPAPF